MGPQGRRCLVLPLQQGSGIVPTYKRSLPVASSLAVAGMLFAAACAGGKNQDTGAPGVSPPPSSDDAASDAAVSDEAEAEAGQPFQADPPAVYVAKVKNILVGMPPTDAEIQQVAADPTQLGTLIAGWQGQAEYATKMTRFFQLAFQQTQVTLADFSDQALPGQIANDGAVAPLLVQNAQESFARTMVYFAQHDQPLTLGLTTHQLMMTTALKELYAFLDGWVVDDAGNVNDTWANAIKKSSPTAQISALGSGDIPAGANLDPTSKYFLQWVDPDVGTTANATTPGCQQTSISYEPRGLTLHFLLYGTLAGWTGSYEGQPVKCLQYGGTAQAPQLTANDFSDWTLVTIAPPSANQPTTVFYDLPSLRSATQLVLSQPRTGFFSTPAFFANWQTNTSNTMRVTMNQALIVALGSSMDGTDTTVPPSTPGLDTTHATQPACYACHRLLDPTRSIFSATWSWNYHTQDDSSLTSQPGLFAFRGVINQNVHTLDDFANVLAAHPLFAPAWVEKLCYYANSSACDPSDPLFAKIVSDFQASGYNWNALVKEILSSPMVTNAQQTATAAQNGEVVAVSRRDHLCAALNARLGIVDVCGLLATTSRSYVGSTIPQVAGGLPSDAYGRGSAIPVLPNAPTLFYRAGTESICAALANEVIDTPSSVTSPPTQQWSSSNPDAAIADFVTLVMAIEPSDPRYAQAIAILTNHFTQASNTSGIKPTDALRSTFVAACMAPSAIGIGM